VGGGGPGRRSGNGFVVQEFHGCYGKTKQEEAVLMFLSWRRRSGPTARMRGAKNYEEEPVSWRLLAKTL